jgi:hypothetical protein
MSAPKAATAAQTIEEREAQLSAAQRKLAADRAKLAAERKERDARIADAQRAAEASVLDGIETEIRDRRVQQINAEQHLNALADAEVLDVSALAEAFDTAANAAAALRGYQQAAHDALAAAGRDESAATDGTGGITQVTRHRFEPDAAGKLVPAYDETGRAVMETVTVRPRPKQHEGMPFGQYLDRVLVRRQGSAERAGSSDLTQALDEARQIAAQDA